MAACIGQDGTVRRGFGVTLEKFSTVQKGRETESLARRVPPLEATLGNMQLFSLHLQILQR